MDTLSFRSMCLRAISPLAVALAIPIMISLAWTASASAQPKSCTPTPPDALGPFYKPGAPERNSVGRGYVLSGTAKSSADCSPVKNARIELWLAGPDGGYGDAYRATVFSDTAGAYRFESSFPPPYAGRPPHIHLRVSAEGFNTLVTQHYPVKGRSGAVFDLVLVPAK